MAGEITLCLFCGMEAMQNKLDKKGRPYLACFRCRCTVFLRDQIQVAGYGEAVRHLDRRAFLDAFGKQAEFIARGGLARPGFSEPRISAPVSAPAAAGVAAGGAA